MSDWYDPDMSSEEFRRLGHRTIDMIAEYFESIRDLPVYPRKTADEVAAVFEEALPREGQSPDAILDAWTEKILPNATHLGSPRYFGFVNGSGAMIAVLAEALAAAVNMNVGGWKPAPAATEIERRTIRWIAEAIGYPVECGGLFTSGGMMANFTAITAALRNAAEYDMAEEGLQSPDRTGRFRLYMSDHEGHVSIKAAADMTGIGRGAVVPVPSRDDMSMDVGELRRAIDADRAAGEIPFCVVAQIGSINVGVVDPIEEIADLCEEYGLWFHADGACGAFGAMLPEKRDQYRGMERADSLTLDPHKWLYVPYECGAVLVRDPERLRRAFSMSAPYLRGTIPTEYDGLDYYDHGPQMSRGFRALKVWMMIKQYGLEGYRKLLRQNNACAMHMHELVKQSPDFEVIHEPNLYIYSFRFVPANMQGSPRDEPAEVEIDRLNQTICDELQLSSEAFVMTSRIRGRVVIRISVCSHRTTPADIERVFERMHAIGRASLRHA